MDAKECTKCGEVKPFDDFYNRSASKDGKRPCCKLCVRSFSSSKNRDRKEYMAEWRPKNKTRTSKYQSKWRASNKHKVSAKAAKRRANKAQRTPSWANDQLIAAYYKEAKRLEELTGIQFHVDHIIPLQGELVSGLHVETNLQLLPAHENIGKSNSFDPDLFVA